MALSGNVLAGALEKLKGGTKPATAAPEAEELQPLEMAAEEFLSAVESKDPKAIAEALRGAVEICMGESE